VRLFSFEHVSAMSVIIQHRKQQQDPEVIDVKPTVEEVIIVLRESSVYYYLSIRSLIYRTGEY
jgi:hypothetical protein